MTSNLFSLIFLVLILCSSSFLISASDSNGEIEFSYKNEDTKGPENWENLKPEWKICGTGKLQSPIDILRKKVKELPQLGKLKKDYRPAPATLHKRGPSVMLEWNDEPGNVDINGTYYKLKQCHWHTPAEHTLNGLKYDMELHAVHQNSKGDMAVIGMWFKIGRPDPLLSKLLRHITSNGEKHIDVGIIHPREIKFGGTKYYRYIGSFTSPPCTEGVVWTIVKKVRTVSIEQLKALKELVNKGFEENARATQDLDGREVWFYNPKKST